VSELASIARVDLIVQNELEVQNSWWNTRQHMLYRPAAVIVAGAVAPCDLGQHCLENGANLIRKRVGGYDRASDVLNRSRYLLKVGRLVDGESWRSGSSQLTEQEVRTWLLKPEKCGTMINRVCNVGPHAAEIGLSMGFIVDSTGCRGPHFPTSTTLLQNMGEFVCDQPISRWRAGLVASACEHYVVAQSICERIYLAGGLSGSVVGVNTNSTKVASESPFEESLGYGLQRLASRPQDLVDHERRIRCAGVGRCTTLKSWSRALIALAAARAFALHRCV
jgi:hypothetical protein